MKATGQVQEFPPQASSRLWSLFAVECTLGLVIGAMAVRGNSAGIAVGLAFIFLGIAFPVTYWLWLANTRLLIARGVVGYQDLWGRRRLWSSSDIARVVEITIVYYSPKGGRQPKEALLLVGRDGRCSLKVRSANWAADALDAFTSATGRSTEYAGSRSAGQAAREFPGSVGFMYAHTAWTALITVGIVLVVGVVFEALVLTSR